MVGDVVVAVAGNEGLEPHCLAKVVCGVVEVQVYALLRQGTTHKQCTHGGAVGWCLGIKRNHSQKSYNNG